MVQRTSRGDARNPGDAHRPLGKQHDLAAILSHVETRRVTDDYTIRFEAKIYQIDRQDIRAGYSSIGLVATRDRLRFTGTIKLTCTPGNGIRNRTFLLRRE